MNKIDYIRGKALTYDWGKDKKKFTIEPMTNNELLDLIEDFQKEWDEALGVNLEEETFLNIIRKKPAYFINKIVTEEFTEEDFGNGYPNDIYNIFVTFKEVNFTFLRNLTLKGSSIAQMLTQKK